MDSQIIAEKELRIKETFNQFDFASDGRISDQQLGPALKELGISQTEEELELLSKKLRTKGA